MLAKISGKAQISGEIQASVGFNTTTTLTKTEVQKQIDEFVKGRALIVYFK